MKEFSQASLDAYRRTVNKFEILWGAKQKTPLPKELIQNLTVAVDAIYFIDHTLDESTCGDQRRKFLEDMYLFLSQDNAPPELPPGQLYEAASKLRNVLIGLPESQRKQFNRNMRNFMRITDILREETDTQKFAKYRQLEGQFASRSFLSMIPEELRSSANYRNFVKLLDRIGRLATIVDSTCDLTEDHADGQIRIKPTAVNRIVLLLSAAGDLTYVAVQSVNPTIVKEAARSAYQVLKDSAR